MPLLPMVDHDLSNTCAKEGRWSYLSDILCQIGKARTLRDEADNPFLIEKVTASLSF